MQALLPTPRARRVLRAGSVLFRAGEPVSSLFLVESGRVRLVRYTSSGREVTLALCGPGHLLAEASLFSRHYHCDALADSRSRVAVHSKPAVLRAIADEPAFALGFAEALAREIQALRARIEIRSLRSARERIIAYLALPSRPASGEPLRLRVIASDIGLTPEAFYRALAQLEKDGLIRRSDRTLALT